MAIQMFTVLDGEDTRVGTCHSAKARILVKQGIARWKGERLYLNVPKAEVVPGPDPKVLAALRSIYDDTERALDRVLARVKEGGTFSFEPGVKATDFLGAFGTVEHHGLRVRHVLLHHGGLRHIRALPHFDPEYRLEITTQGYEGSLWAANVMTSDKMPMGMIAFATQEFAQSQGDDRHLAFLSYDHDALRNYSCSS